MVKVLSLKEPYATLIVKGIKHIETRSWKTNYRGEIYIHASKSIISTKDNPKLDNIVKKLELKPTYILCKAKLKDCIYMDEDFLKEIEKDPIEKLCGIYKKGRYAWVLTDVEIIKPVTAKGKLGLWNYENEDL